MSLLKPTRANGWAVGRASAHLGRLTAGTPVTITLVTDDKGVVHTQVRGVYLGQVFDRPTGRIRLNKYDPAFKNKNISDDLKVIELEIEAVHFQRRAPWKGVS